MPRVHGRIRYVTSLVFGTKFNRSLCEYNLCILAGHPEQNLCCTPTTVSDLVSSFGLSLGLIGRCPSCVRNLRQIFCTMTCHPEQSKFMSPESFETDVVNNSTVTLVNGLNYFIMNDYVNALWDSCKDVTNPSSNSLAITTFCGSWGEFCNGQR